MTAYSPGSSGAVGVTFIQSLLMDCVDDGRMLWCSLTCPVRPIFILLTTRTWSLGFFSTRTILKRSLRSSGGGAGLVLFVVFAAVAEVGLGFERESESTV